MIRKTIKYGVLAAAILAVGGVAILGSDAVSYARSTIHGWRASVRDAVPVDHQLERAKDMLDEVIPEIHANIRLIAREEVELASLREDIARSEAALSDQQVKIDKLSGLLQTDRVRFPLGRRSYGRAEVQRDLANRFERYKEAELVLESKRRLLAQRERSLQGAIEMLEKARTQKALLEEKVAALESQHRLVQAAQVGSQLDVRNSKLAQTDRLLDQIKKRLDVAERVLAHEGRFVEPVQLDEVDEDELLRDVANYFSQGGEAALSSTAAGRELPAPVVDDR